ncbi:MAG: TMEM143 family protein [Desulfuromusa sp.]|nr:TMEM143 family protein [Desulfuromusa sp.]
MVDYSARERFIPVDKVELVNRLSHSTIVAAADREDYFLFSKLLDSYFHFEFHSQTENLKQSYLPFNPDSDTLNLQELSPAECKIHESQLIDTFKEVLNQANFQQINEEDLSYAVSEESLLKLNLYVDFDDFENQLVFRRGSRIDQVEHKKGLFKKEIVDMTVYDRVALIIKYKDATYFAAADREKLNFQPGSMIVKLFKNIPKGDLEMLFPNAQVRMRMKDKLLMGGIAVGAGTMVLLKAGTGLIAMAGILWLMTRSMIASGGTLPTLGPVEISGMVGGMTALVAIGAFLFKQWNGYKNRKIKFMKTLGDSLYFKNLDNNAGVFYHIIADAEEEEFKEALLGYLFLLKSDAGLTATELDTTIEEWFTETYATPINFEIDDALDKLKRLKLCHVVENDQTGESRWKALPLLDACRQLDQLWDDFFQVHLPDAP